MSDEHNTPRPKSMPPPVPQRRSVPPPEPTVRDAVPSDGASQRSDGRPTSTRQFRSTTRMTTDEIEAVIAANRAAAAAGGAPPEGFDPERTMVLDPDEDGVESTDAVDEAPTVDYDPRAQLPQTRSGRPAAGSVHQAGFAGPLGTPLIPPAPRVPALTQPSNASTGGESLKDTGKKRSSRRTVKIPDDPVERRNLPQVITRAETSPGAAETRRAGSTTQPMLDPPQDPVKFDAGDTYSDLAATGAHPSAAHLHAAPPSEGGDVSDGSRATADGQALAPMQLNDTTDVLEPRRAPTWGSGEDDGVLRPMRIIQVGSEPPPPITSAIADWPTGSSVGVYTPYGGGPQATAPAFGGAPASGARTEARPASSPAPASLEAETVRKFVHSVTKTDLLPPNVPEDGWTPQAPAVMPRAPAVPQFDSSQFQQAQFDGAPQPLPPQPSPPRTPSPQAVVAQAPAPQVVQTQAPALQISEAEESAQELLEDIEPDASPIPAKKPPPPPTKAQRDATERQRKPDAAEDAPIKKAKPWFEDLFSEDYIKTMDVLPDEDVRREVDFIEESLGVEKQGVILDLACGRGEHAIELASRGYNVVGLDLSPVALAIAHENLRDRLSAAGSEMEAKPSFMRTDMRELNFEENFDGAYCWCTSFGYFEDDVNVAVLKRLHRALRQGGNLLIDVANRDYIAPRSPSLVWFEGDRCTCMDEMQVDFLTSRLKVKRTAMFEDGHSRELEYSLRLYSLDALGRMLREVGFRVVEVTGLIAHPGIFFGSESPRLIILAERT